MTFNTGVLELYDFMPSYLYAVRNLLHDAQGNYFTDAQLSPYINEARKHVCLDLGCLRQLLTPTLPANVEKFNIGGVYDITSSIATPDGTPPFSLVSGGGGAAVADTTAVPMVVNIASGGAGTYYQAPIVTFDAPNLNISATAIAMIDTVITSVGATLYGTSTADGTLTSANTLVTAAGTNPDGSTSIDASATPGTYGEMPSQGTVSSWPDLGSLPMPSGDGFIWDSAALGAAQLAATTWNPVLNVSLSQSSVQTATFIFYFRVFQYTPSPQGWVQIVAAQSAPTAITGSATISTWSNNVSVATDFGPTDQLYVDVIAYYVDGLEGSITVSLNYNGSKICSTGPFGYVPPVGGLSSIEVLSDAGIYNANAVTPQVNIVPVGIGAVVQDDGTGNLEIVSQGYGQDNGCVIQDAAGLIFTFDVNSISILPKAIASVDAITIVWNSQRYNLRNMAFSDFSAALRAWVLYQNIPLAYSVYADAIYIGPKANQAYTYELDCIMYPDPLTGYQAVGQITDRTAVAAVKYYAAYLAKMGQQEVQEAGIFKELYDQQVGWGANKYTTRLSRMYQANENLE